MAKRPRYDRIEPWRPPEPPQRRGQGGQRSAEPAAAARHGRPHAKVEPAPAAAAAGPVDVDGVAIITVGTILWAVAFFVLLPFRDRLAHHGLDWWLWTCVAGVGLGLWGIRYCRRRRDRLAGVNDRGVPPSS